MAAMAPALTDASAHPSSFKLPVSPSDPEQNGFEATPSDPTSPGLPNGHINTGQTQINSGQAVQNSVADKSLISQRGGNVQLGSNGSGCRTKARLLTSNSQIGGLPTKSRLTSRGRLNRRESGESVTLPLSNKALGLRNGREALGSNISKMNHPTVPGAYDKQPPSSAHTVTTTNMPPETSTLSLSNTDTSGCSSTATADSSEADDDMRAVQNDQPHDQMESSLRGSKSCILEMMEVKKVEEKRCNTGDELLSELVESQQVEEIHDKHCKFAQRARQLMQKLRHLQSQQLGTHTKEQIRNFVQDQHRSAEAAAVEADLEGCPNCKRNSVQSTASGTNDLSTSQKVQNKSGSIDESTNGTLTPSCNHKRKPVPTKPIEDASERIAVKTASKKLQARLAHVQSWVDSDETESSSGGESCDEGDDTLPAYTQPRLKHKVPLHRRAAWKWATERAAVASRWTWLQAQVSDLEYRIRQQSDIYRQTRASKGVAILGEPASSDDVLKVRVMASSKMNRKLSPIEAKIARLGGNQEMSPSNLSTLVDQQSVNLKRSLQNCTSPMPGLTVPPSHTSTPTGPAGKVPLSKPLNGVVGSSSSHGSSLFNNSTSSTTTAHKQTEPGLSSFSPFPSARAPQIPEDQYCARTRPVWYFRKRKLIRTMNLHSFNRKMQKLSTVRCGCCQPLMPCVMCGGRFNHVEKAKEPDMAPINERIAQLDYSFHPVLSFPQDIPLSIHFEGMLKSNGWLRKPQLSKQSAMKKRRRPSTPVESKEGQKPKKKYERKNKDKSKRHQGSGEDKSLKMLRKLAAQTMKDMRHGRGDGKILKPANSKARSLQSTPKKLLTDELNRRCRTDIKKRRAAQLAIAALKKTRARSLSLPNIKDHFHRSMSSSSIGSSMNDGTSAATQLSQSFSSSSLQNFLKPRRPGANSDQYDIDNIVIPYSMLASTRVEKLEYKEIMTPKWRKIPEKQLMAWKNHVQDHDDQEDDIEIFSDSEIMERHTKCEVTERQKFLTLLANQANTHHRRGARRSRNNSQGNTPEPYSPDTNPSEQNLPSSVNSSNAPSPLTTQEALSPSGNAPTSSKGSGPHRSRTSFWEKRRSSSASDTNLEASLMGRFEEIGHIDNPWPVRNFPLTDSEVAELGCVPEEESTDQKELEETTSAEISSMSVQHNLKMERGLSRSSPFADMLEDDSSEPEEVDDPNDPEWTVVSPERHRSSIVLRLAKR